jgi:hypothetical protein
MFRVLKNIPRCNENSLKIILIQGPYLMNANLGLKIYIFGHTSINLNISTPFFIKIKIYIER